MTLMTVIARLCNRSSRIYRAVFRLALSSFGMCAAFHTNVIILTKLLTCLDNFAEAPRAYVPF